MTLEYGIRCLGLRIGHRKPQDRIVHPLLLVDAMRDLMEHTALITEIPANEEAGLLRSPRCHQSPIPITRLPGESEQSKLCGNVVEQLRQDKARYERPHLLGSYSCEAAPCRSHALLLIAQQIAYLTTMTLHRQKRPWHTRLRYVDKVNTLVYRCGYCLMEDGPWEPSDYEVDPKDGESYPSDEAKDRAYDRKYAEIEEAIASGALVARGKGRRAKLAWGPLHDWAGLRVPVTNDWGMEYDVQPDSRQHEVDRQRHDHALVKKLLDRNACLLDLPLDLESPLELPSSPANFGVELARLTTAGIRAGLDANWRELRAIEDAVNAASKKFDGEDMFYPRTRERFDAAKAQLLALHEDLEKYTGPRELPEPDVEARAGIARIMEREAVNAPTV